ncbi:hypothetical protein FACS1894130_09280 [Spirochaetia bacterium]|nr:hypothetical protein FACS1894130_09280 [Spirochaetia bacterium]
MNKRNYFISGFLVFFLVNINASPDRQRWVIDNLIGLNGNNIIAHQIISDNMGSHWEYIYEEYLVEKHIENGKTVVIKQIKITEENKIETILLKEYNGNIIHMGPVMDYFVYNPQPLIENRYIESKGNRIDLKEYISYELINCRIIRIVDVYEINGNTYFAIDLTDRTNYYRKIIMISNEVMYYGGG